MNRYDFIRDNVAIRLRDVFITALSQGATKGDLQRVAREEIDMALRYNEEGAKQFKAFVTLVNHTRGTHGHN